MLRRGEDLYFLRVRITSALVAGTARAVLTIVALVARGPRTIRRWRRRPPRVVWGNTPIVNIKYWSAALRDAGCASRTIVSHVYPSNDPADFDVVADTWLAGRRRLAPIRDFLLFARVLWSDDIVCAFFDGGFLKATSLGGHEVALLHLAGIKLVLTPFGSDIAVRGHLGATEEGFAAHYPALLDRSDATRERVDRLCAQCDFVVKTFQIGYLPRHDAFWSHALAVDTDYWRPGTESDRGAGDDDVVVIHAPNHRQLKGTDAVIAAVDQLRAEGLHVRLELLERRPNEEVRQALRHADIAVDQLLTGYGLFAVECLASGLPVLSNLRWMPEPMRRTSVVESPIVDADRDDVTDRLRELVRDADRRQRLATASRDFALRYHAYDVSGRVWCQLFEHVWLGRPLTADLAPLSAERSAT